MDIDVVYTWVNHTDATWQRIYETAVSETVFTRDTHRSATDLARFVARNELYYSVKSVLKHAPWVRNIYVVSNCALPDWTNAFEQITHVAHEEIFEGDNFLPTFNSHAIETVLHRIRGLSENFLYFNDDVFLCQDVNPRDFFWADGGVYYFPSKHDIPYEKIESLLRPVDSGAINAAALLFRDFGRKPMKKLHHSIFPHSKILLEEMEMRYGDEIQSTRSNRFRDPKDVAVATTLHAYYSDYVGRGREKRIAARYVDIGNPLFPLLLNPLSPLMRGKYMTL